MRSDSCFGLFHFEIQYCAIPRSRSPRKKAFQRYPTCRGRPLDHETAMPIKQRSKIWLLDDLLHETGLLCLSLAFDFRFEAQFSQSECQGVGIASHEGLAKFFLARRPVTHPPFIYDDSCLFADRCTSQGFRLSLLNAQEGIWRCGIC